MTRSFIMGWITDLALTWDEFMGGVEVLLIMSYLVFLFVEYN
jgi:hypothetical protein